MDYSIYMFDALIYLGVCALGYIVASPLRKEIRNTAIISQIETVTTLLMIFSMGARIGATKEVVDNLGTYGAYSLLFTLVIIAFSVFTVSVLRRSMGFDKFAKKSKADISIHDESTVRGSVATAEPHSETGGDNNSPDDKTNLEDEESTRKALLDHTTRNMLICIIIGFILGWSILRFGSIYLSIFESIIGKIIMLELIILLFFIGLSMGLEGKVGSTAKNMGIIAFLIPVTAAMGTFIGATVCSFILPLSLKDCFALGSGFGWYSLSSGIIMDSGKVDLGAMAFMHNVMREFISILLIPTIAEKIGYLESVASAGATAGDVCLPVVTQSTNSDTAICSFMSGVIMSMMVPVLVPLFL